MRSTGQGRQNPRLVEAVHWSDLAGGPPPLSRPASTGPCVTTSKAVAAAGLTRQRRSRVRCGSCRSRTSGALASRSGKNGRLVRDMYLFQVKTPAESKAPWDYYKILATIPGDEAFRPCQREAAPGEPELSDGAQETPNRREGPDVSLHPTLVGLLGQRARPDASPSRRARRGRRAKVFAASCAALGAGPKVGAVRDLDIPTRGGAVRGRLIRPTMEPSTPAAGADRLRARRRLGSRDLGRLRRDRSGACGAYRLRLLMVDYGSPRSIRSLRGLRMSRMRSAGSPRTRRLHRARAPPRVAGDSAGGNLATVALAGGAGRWVGGGRRAAGAILPGRRLRHGNPELWPAG